MRGGGFRASLAIVLRVTSGMLAAEASLAPVPTLIVTPAPPLDPTVPVVARLGMPVLFPGWILEIPPEPVMKNDVGMAVPGEGIIRT
jgi:hypothetical protein